MAPLVPPKQQAIMSDQHQTHALTTSSIPPLLGVLAIALLRHWRFVAHEETERWLAVIDRLLAAYRHAPDAFAYTVHRLSTADGYRHWSARYDHGANPLILAEQPVLAELIARRGVGTALDAACGTGRVSALLAAAGHAVTGIDASEAMLAKAVAKVPGAVFRSGDLTALPFADDAFDLVTCCLALTHCIDLAVPIAELARAAAPGATILLSDIHPHNAFLGGHAGFTYLDNTFAVVENQHHPFSDYLRAFQAAGLRVRECIEPSFTEAQADLFTGLYLANEDWLRAELEPDLTATVRAALVGFPVALTWELEKT